MLLGIVKRFMESVQLNEYICVGRIEEDGSSSVCRDKENAKGIQDKIGSSW